MTPFAPLFVADELLDAVSGEAWLEAMLEFESALARTVAAAGVVPEDAAAAIADACRPDLYDLPELLERGRAVGNPAEPLVRALRGQVGGDAAGYVHRGATSQDVMDTAAMIVSRRALGLILDELDRVAASLATLAQAHRSTPMAARTLLQQAVPTTFGVKAAGWLVAVLEARGRLERVRAERLAVQLGGAAGTLAALGTKGTEVLRALAEQLELAEPVLPWHTNRTRIAELGAALDLCASVLAKVGLDLVLLAQTEVGEVQEQTDGGSSTMPQKRNPVRSVLARACAELVSAYAAVLSKTVVQEHERAAGAWHAEWAALSGALAYAGGAAWNVADALEGLDVDAERMRKNLELTDGLIVAERVAVGMGGDGHDVVREAALRAGESGRTFAEELEADDRVELSAETLDPEAYLGSAEAFVDRALALYREERT
jgi:3-carboxy-cis,cis-muconate cycloisomerase